jgi:hypothetical protein
MYVLVALISFLFAVLFFNIGGSLAEITNSSGTFLGFGFKAGGAIAGFLLIFWASIKAIDHFSTTAPATPFDIRLKVKGADQQFKVQDAYIASCSILRGDKDNTVDVEPRWDNANYLAIDLAQILPDDKIAVVIKNRDEGDRQWQVSRFLLKEPLQDARFVGPRLQGRKDGEVGQGPTGGRSIQVEQGPSSSGPRTATGGRRIGIGPINRDAPGAPKK